MLTLILGGGDLASGAAWRLSRAGLRLAIIELPQPLAVRRKAAFAEAVFAGETTVQGIRARRVDSAAAALALSGEGGLPVLAESDSLRALQAVGALIPTGEMILVDGRMTKRPPEYALEVASLVVGLGPGFCAGVNCQAVIETQRGPHLGRVYWEGAALPDTGIPEAVGEQRSSRVLRAPADGPLEGLAEIGEQVEAGQPVARVAGKTITAPFPGVLRGLMHPGLYVTAGLKIGDLDPRRDPALCSLISDKALAVGGGLLEALLTWPEIRRRLWE